jgi:hypothetical protein
MPTLDAWEAYLFCRIRYGMEVNQWSDTGKRVEAIGYMRTSSAANIGDGKDSEARPIEGYAKATGMVIVDWFYDAAVSGADGRTRCGQQLVTLARELRKNPNGWSQHASLSAATPRRAVVSILPQQLRRCFAGREQWPLRWGRWIEGCGHDGRPCERTFQWTARQGVGTQPNESRGDRGAAPPP